MSSCAEGVLHLGSRVVVPILIEAVVEELLGVLGSIVLLVSATVDVTTVVANPDIVVLLSQHICQRFSAANRPSSRFTEETMLQVDSFGSCWNASLGDSEKL